MTFKEIMEAVTNHELVGVHADVQPLTLKSQIDSSELKYEYEYEEGDWLRGISSSSDGWTETWSSDDMNLSHACLMFFFFFSFFDCLNCKQ